MLKIAVVDDEEIYIQQIKTYLEQYSEEKHQSVKISTFRDGSQLLKNYVSRFDIILLDIEMEQINGMDTAKKIREMDEKVVLVFVTNISKYAINGYEVGALDYILKPLDYYNFCFRMDRAISRVKKYQTEMVELILPNGIRYIRVGQIHYIEVQNRLLHYYTEEGEFIVKGTLQKAEEQLKDCHFVRCNHWYLVNLEYVREIRKNIAVVAGKELEISRRNKNTFLSTLTDYIGMGIL